MSGFARDRSDPLSTRPAAPAQARAPRATVPLAPGAHRMVQLQRTAGNAAVAGMVNRDGGATGGGGAEREDECSCGGSCARCGPTVARQPAGGADPGEGSATGPPSLLVEGTAGPGQMTKEAFLTELRTEVTATAEAVLGPTGWSSRDCPDLVRWFDYYQAKDAGHVERAVRRYAPGSADAATARDYIPVICSRVRRAVLTWALSGEVTGIPDELAASADTPAVPPPEDIAAPAGAGEPGTAGGGGPSSAGPGDGPGATPAGVQRAAREGGAPVRASAARLVDGLGPGAPLDAGVAARLGDGLGADLSGVRVHDGAEAAAAAASLGARAFTYGRHVGFDAGEYRPGTPAGDAILAHELAHVVQQGGAAPGLHAASRGPEGDEDAALEHDADRSATHAVARLWGIAGQVTNGLLHAPGRLRTSRPRLQRCRRDTGPRAAPSDYLIEGLSRKAASTPDSIFFERNSSAIPPSEAGKIAGIANPTPAALAANPLGLFGYVSEDENNPATLAQARLDAVAAGVTAQSPVGASVPTKSSRHGDTAGRIDYREVRMVESVRSAGLAPPVPNQPACQPGVSTVVPCTPQQQATLTAGVTQGGTWIQTARDKIATGDAAALALAAQLFNGGVAPVPAAVRATLVSKLDLWKAHLATLNQAGKHECRQCGDCENTPAYNNGVGAASKMTLCPTWLDGGAQGAIATLVHEAGHGTSGVETVDHAYGHTRRIHALTQAEALENTDSYVLMVRSLNGHAVSIGPSTADDVSGLSAAGVSSQRVQAQRSIAWTETYLVQAYQLLSDTYAYVKTCRDNGRWEAGWGHTGMQKVSSRLPGLSTPRAVGVTPGPTVADRDALAAIHDRYHAMRDVMWGKPVRAVPGATSAWSAGPGSTVTLSPAFFALTPRQQLDTMLELIIRATPGISPALVPGYLALVDDMRRERGVGSP